jgi:hypothetical protein
VPQLGAKNVFQDVVAIPAGQDFAQVIGLIGFQRG